MKKIMLLAVCSLAIIGISTAPWLIAQNPADNSVTRPDHLSVYGDPGTCNEGETEYNMVIHAGKRCTAPNTWSTIWQNVQNGDVQLLANSATGISAQRIAHATYKFSVDGGAIGAIVPASNVTLPANAVITNVAVNSTVAFVGATATIAIGTTAGSSATSLVTVAQGPVANYTLNGFVQGTPVPITASTWVKLTAPGQIQLTVATAPLTAGQAELYVFYYLSSS
jgi:hypothetical protein